MGSFGCMEVGAGGAIRLWNREGVGARAVGIDVGADCGWSRWRAFGCWYGEDGLGECRV